MYEIKTEDVYEEIKTRLLKFRKSLEKFRKFF